MTIKIQLRRDSSANWALANPVLALGEVGYDTTAKKIKIGDGSTTWNALDYTLTGPSATPPTDVRTDYAHPYSYCATAPKDSADSAALWTIKRIQINADGSATVTTATNVAWTNRLTATYS